MSEFDTRRQQEEEARRARAATRDAERREALASGARAPSAADGSDPTGVLRAASVGAGALAASVLVLGWVTGFPVVGFGVAAVFGAAAFGLHRARARRLAERGPVAGPAAPVSTALSTAPTEEQAWRRARAAVEAAPDLDPSRRKTILRALDAARESVRAGVGPERLAEFVARCDEIVSSLGGLPAAGVAPGSALEHLDAVTVDLAHEATAKAEIEEALRTARGAASRQTEG